MPSPLVSASAERIDAGWLAVKEWAAVQGEASCRRMSAEMGDTVIADDMAFRGAVPAQSQLGCEMCGLFWLLLLRPHMTPQLRPVPEKVWGEQEIDHGSRARARAEEQSAKPSASE